MAKGDKYIELQKYLEKSQQNQVILTYGEIEQIVGFVLPKSAYTHSSAWWANDVTHSQAIAWLEADYLVEDIRKENIVFQKNK